MAKKLLPTNFIKHTSKNPIQRLLINNFYLSVASLVKHIYPKTILDAGCGEGFTMSILKKNKIGKRFEGIEYEKEAITLAKKTFPDLVIKQGNIYNLSYKNSFFDLVTCTEVLEHLENPKQALKEIERVAKKYVLLSVPNEPFFMLSNFLRGKNLSKFGNDPGHVNHWTVLSFINFVKKNGLRILKIRLPFPWIIVLAEKQ